MTRAAFRLLALTAVFLPLLGCAGASTRFYTLDAAPASGAPPSAYSGPPLRVDVVHIPATLDRAELVREVAGQRVMVSDNDHWAAPLGELLRRALSQDLAARLPLGMLIFPEAPKPAGARGVVVDILAMTPTNSDVVMDVSWSFWMAPPGGGPPAPGGSPVQRTLRLITPRAGPGVSGNAAELSALMGQLADAIAADVSRSSP